MYCMVFVIFKLQIVVNSCWPGESNVFHKMTTESYFSILLFSVSPCNACLSLSLQYRGGCSGCRSRVHHNRKGRSIFTNPFERWPFKNSTILFNVLGCTLMDTSSRTSSSCPAPLYAYFMQLRLFFFKQSQGEFILGMLCFECGNNFVKANWSMIEVKSWFLL